MPRQMRVKNVEKGFWNATGFHPLRSSRDYDPDRAGGDYSDTPAKRKSKAKSKKKKGKAKRKNPTGLPIGKFVAVKAVRRNRDGSITVAVEHKRRAKRK